MIGLDTNILIRLLVQDDPAQYQRALRLIVSSASDAVPVFVGIVTLVEFVWALNKIYRYSEPEILSALDRVLTIEGVIVENDEAVATAIGLCKSRGLSFADAIICTIHGEMGCTQTVSFDLDLVRSGLAVEP